MSVFSSSVFACVRLMCAHARVRMWRHFYGWTFFKATSSWYDETVRVVLLIELLLFRYLFKQVLYLGCILVHAGQEECTVIG